MYFYPERGQPEALQDRDRYECYRLAVRDSGVDPGMTPVSRAWSPPPPPVRATAPTWPAVRSPEPSSVRPCPARATRAERGDRRRVRRAAGCGVQESRAQAAEAAQARQADAQARARQPLDNFRRAMGACMQSRGYTVG
jgi:hypothetical protein